MRVVIFLFFLLFGFSNARSQVMSIVQDTTVKLEAPTYFDTIDVKPKFKGDLYGYLRNNLKFPPGAVPKGTVYSVLWIDTTGKVTSVEIENKKPAQYNAVDKEVVRALKAMPAWIPGRSSEGRKKTVKYSLPLQF